MPRSDPRLRARFAIGASFALALSLLALAAAVSSVRAASPGVASVQGTGFEVAGLEVVSWLAVSVSGAPDVKPVGRAAYCFGFSDPQQTCLDGDPIQLVAPTTYADYWCLTSEVSNHDAHPPDPGEVDYRAVLLYREGSDAGGRDEIDLHLGPRVACDALPSPPDFRPLAWGEIAAVWL